MTGRGVRASRRRVLSALVLTAAVTLQGCAGAPVTGERTQGTTLDSRAVLLADLNGSMRAVSVAQAVAEPGLTRGIAAVRRLNDAVAGLRDAGRVYATRDEWPVVATGVAGVDLETMRPDLRALAFAVDAARTSLRRAKEQVADEDWEIAYLDASDEVLARMRDYAASGDAIAQILERHLPTWSDTIATTTSFVEAAWFYRDGAEAAGAYEIEIRPHVAGLDRASAELDAVREEHRIAGEAVNAASAVATAAYARRPSAEPDPGVGS